MLDDITVANILNKVDTSGGPDACWPWTGKIAKNGRGRTEINGKRKNASRVALILKTGLNDPEMFACHSCDNPICVNPSHLWWGTHQDNMDDMVDKGRQSHNIRHLEKLHCPQGHPYEYPHLYIKPNGHRMCNTCKNLNRNMKRQLKMALLRGDASLLPSPI